LFFSFQDTPPLVLSQHAFGSIKIRCNTFFEPASSIEPCEGVLSFRAALRLFKFTEVSILTLCRTMFCLVRGSLKNKLVKDLASSVVQKQGGQKKEKVGVLFGLVENGQKSLY
jgi:hypothetical protein